MGGTGRTNAVGGAALNFKVVPGLTQPGTASENTIWVKTERIGSWYFSATQPEGLQEWDVWFPTGTESDVEFNALKKNGIQVYPLSAKQMISGSLVDVTAMSYQGGDWVEWWEGELYDSGNQYEYITGGWKKVRPSISALDATFDATQITVAKVSGSGYDLTLYTNNKVDVTRFTKLTAVVELAFPVNYNNQGVRVGLIDTNTEQYPDSISAVYKNCTATGSQTVVVDLSSVSGEFYPFLQFSVATGAIKKVYLS